MTKTERLRENMVSAEEKLGRRALKTKHAFKVSASKESHIVEMWASEERM